MKPDIDKSRIEALVNLLQDDNLKVASLAMEQILNLGSYAQQIVDEYTNSSNARLRRRIHQLNEVLNRRNSRQRFLEALNNEKIGLWEGILEINKVHNPDFTASAISDEISTIVNNMALQKKDPSIAEIADFMREQGFTVPEEDILDTELYLPDCVVSFKYGAAVLLCALTYEVGSHVNWQPSIALHEGRFCLTDEGNLVLDPADNWSVKRSSKGDALNRCGKREVWLGILSQLFLVSMMEGDLHEVYNWGNILAALEGKSIERFPYPLGEATD